MKSGRSRPRSTRPSPPSGVCGAGAPRPLRGHRHRVQQRGRGVMHRRVRGLSLLRYSTVLALSSASITSLCANRRGVIYDPVVQTCVFELPQFYFSSILVYFGPFWSTLVHFGPVNKNQCTVYHITVRIHCWGGRLPSTPLQRCSTLQLRQFRFGFILNAFTHHPNSAATFNCAAGQIPPPMDPSWLQLLVMPCKIHHLKYKIPRF